MPTTSRRKPFKYKQNRITKAPKTSRTKLSPIARAFVVGAVLASRDGYASAKALAARMGRTQQGLSSLIQRVEQRVKDSGFNIWTLSSMKLSLAEGVQRS